MSVDTTYASSILVEEFTSAAADEVDAAFGRLAGALWTPGTAQDQTLWEGGTLTERAPAAIPGLIAALDGLDAGRAGRLLILLGLIAEAGQVEAVRAGLDRYLDLARHATPALGQALAYLLAHFPDDRDRVLGAAGELGLDSGDRSRLERCLRTMDAERTGLGRVWPAPEIWRLTPEERAFDRAWIGALTDEQAEVNWRNDSRTVWGYMGLKAYWSVRHGLPVTTPGPQPPPQESAGGDDPRLDLFRPHAAALACPACRGPLDVGREAVRCPACEVAYPAFRGILDLTRTVRDDADEATADLLKSLAEMPSMGLYYEALLRPEFLRVAGGNWGGAVTLADEDAYIGRSVNPVDGPVLDLGAGAGRWTEVIAAAVGADRLLALDLGLPMLNVLRHRLPEVPAVLASALDLPLPDASMGAVVCWNALHAFPDDAAAAIAEVGRVLRPGGTFTLMTFVWDEDPVCRHFQASHYFPSRPAGMLLFERAELDRWLADAGMVVRESSGPESFVFLTAQRVS
ncbi:methyltransferase domain-containing protein [Planomonospora sp. ID67723]|uniref:methyltransferase domain-containing protein n=1 Tax=Planomonospora sp. ID67723 TaxID=2738134 RepID=UPI0018C3D3BB|nr:methyltransferase domain-containing protein [Planomonospora sp. ID67723]MBG0829110.1 methyltransferase domain-containing protein [Planomonospora sp. ID67723]